MNLTVRTQLNNMLHKTSQLSGAMKSNLEMTVEMAAALDDIGRIQAEGQKLCCMLNDLDLARTSLESLGYSEEWLSTVNHDGHFLQAINVDLSDLIGTIEDKAEVCMEGLWDTIKNILLRIWDFICGLIKKVVGFLTWIIGLFSTDLRSEESVRESLKKSREYLSGKKDITEADLCKKIGESIDKELSDTTTSSGDRSGEGGAYAFDRRDLLMRAVMSEILADTLTGVVFGSFGNIDIANLDSDVPLYSTGLMDYFGSNRNINFFFAAFVEMANKDAGALREQTSIKPIIWSGFKTTNATKDLKKQCEAVGLSIHEDGPAIVPMAESLKAISYAAVYKRMDDYLDVQAAIEFNLKSLNTARAAHKAKLEKLFKLCENLKKFVARYDTIIKKNKTGDLITSDDEKGLNMADKAHDGKLRLKLLSMWVQAAAQCIARFDTDSQVCCTKLKSIGTTIKRCTEAACAEVKNEAK